MESNPYIPPSSDLGSVESFANECSELSQGTISILHRNRFWIRLVSVLLFIFAALSLAIGVIQLFSSGIDGAAILAMQVLSALIYFYPATKLSACASAMQTATDSRRFSDLGTALNEQRAFWKFAAIASILLTLLVLLSGWLHT